MCGLYFSSSIHQLDVKGLEESMTERGGDDFKYRSIETDYRLLNLAHSRLEINARGNVIQPCVGGNIAILFNGEIYNYRNLTSDGADLSEIEVIYSLYQQGGIDSLKSLDGMFAIVIVDLEKQQVICLRDFVGQKPLWTNQSVDSFEIASDPSYFQVVKKEREHYVNYVSKVNLGIGLGLSSLTGIKEVGCNKIEVFDLTSGNRLSSNTLFEGLSGYKAHNKEVFEDGGFSTVITKAVKDVVPEQEFGLFLSGGLDSRAILTALMKIGSPPKCCFTLKGSEANVAAKVASFYGIPLRVIDVDSAENVRIVKSYLSSQNLTSVDPAAIALVVLSKACRDNGLKVALCGDGGDEALLGYDFFFGKETKVAGCKAEVISWFFKCAGLLAGSSKEANLVANTAVGLHLSRKERIPGLFRLSLSFLNSSQLLELYELVSSYKTLQDFYYGFVLPQSLCRKTDTAAHHAKIEVRSPFLQLDFLSAGRAYAEEGLITDNTKKLLRDFCKETFEVAPIGPKTGLNLELEKSIQVMKDVLNEVENLRDVSKELPGSSSFFSAILPLFFMLNRKARYSSLKIRGRSLTI